METSKKPFFNKYRQKMIYDQALLLQSLKDTKHLVAHFKKYLPSSKDPKFWALYIDHIQSIDGPLIEAYEYAVKNIAHHWGAHDIYRGFIETVRRTEDSSAMIEKIREIYTGILSTPMPGLARFWNDYEDFESGVNRTLARRIITEVHPVYLVSSKAYALISPFLSPLTLDNASKIISKEIKNPLSLNETDLLARMVTIFEYFTGYFWDSEEMYFSYSEYLRKVNRHDDACKVVKAGIENTSSTFLKVYYANITDDFEIYGNELERQYDDILAYNYLTHVLRKEGHERFRQLFVTLKHQYPINPTIYHLSASVEYRITRLQGIPTSIYLSALEKFPQSQYLIENFFEFLLSVGDETNARALFAKSPKTQKMWDRLLSHTFVYGPLEEYTKLAEECAASDSSTEVHKLKKADSNSYKEYEIYKSSVIGDMAVDRKIIEVFLSQLPDVDYQDDVLYCVDIDRFIKFFCEINI